MGNPDVTTPRLDRFERQQKEPNFGGNQTNLNRFFDVSASPAPTSDIIALMVLEHQTPMHNFITRLNYEATIALRQYGHLNYLRTMTEAFLRYLLFVEEAPMTTPLRGPKGKQERSLRDFDLETRLFKHPCSYLIYSEAFDALPEPMKERLHRRLHTILIGEDKSADFRNIPPRRAGRFFKF